MWAVLCIENGEFLYEANDEDDDYTRGIITPLYTSHELYKLRITDFKVYKTELKKECQQKLDKACHRYCITDSLDIDIRDERYTSLFQIVEV